MDKIIEALQMAKQEIENYYKEIKVDRSNVLTAVEDALLEARDWKLLLDEYKEQNDEEKNRTNHIIEIPFDDSKATITTNGIAPKILLT